MDWDDGKTLLYVRIPKHLFPTKKQLLTILSRQDIVANLPASRKLASLFTSPSLRPMIQRIARGRSTCVPAYGADHGFVGLVRLDRLVYLAQKSTEWRIFLSVSCLAC
jgi:hypothetical protein